ncbi:MAG: hypothetical protein K1060chlam1_00564 [Candidatus Anoxychlamydiales bacterium]|nr:hypothetical protein [Candidatus Anoxychlamydiales bacterium]
MAMVGLPGFVMAPPTFASSKPQVSGLWNSAECGVVEPSKVLNAYLGRVTGKYNVNTSNIAKLANKLFSSLLSPNIEDYVRDAIYSKSFFYRSFEGYPSIQCCFKDTFIHTFLDYIGGLFEEKTSLGKVLEELDASRESPGRKLLPRKTYREAEKQAKERLDSIKFEDFIYQFYQNKEGCVYGLNNGTDKSLLFWWKSSGKGRAVKEYVFQVMHFNTTIESTFRIFPAPGQSSPEVKRRDGNLVVSWVDSKFEQKEKVF